MWWLFVDSSDILLYLLFLAVCIGVNSFLSRFETAIAESRRSRLERFADGGDERAGKALDILEAPEDLLSVAQIGITATSILLGLVIGIFAAPFLAARFGFFTRFYGLAVLLCVLTVLYLTLLIGEFIPRKIALQDPERVLMENSRTLGLLERVSRPLVRFLSSSANAVLLLFGMNPHIEDTVTEDEVKDLIEQGTEDGTFEKTEQDMVDRIFRMSDQTAYSLMTPRTRMQWLDIEDPLPYNLQLIKKNPDTVFPVGKNNLDDFCGILYAKDLLNAAIARKPLDIQPYIKKPLLIPRSLEMFRVLERFQKSGIHEAVVLDEYGGLIGFITLSDILTEIIGYTSPADERESEQITARSENSWFVDGLCDINDFKEKFDIEELPNEIKDHYQTMGGCLTSYFGYIPQVGESCVWNEFTFEILRMDRARIDKILVTQNDDGKNYSPDEPVA